MTTLALTGMLAHVGLLAVAIKQVRAIKKLGAPSVEPETLPPLAVLISARNESTRLPLLLESLLAQDHPRFTVYVWDDESTDGTLDVVESFSRLSRARCAIKAYRGTPTPAGWIPKTWCQYNLSRIAIESVFLFVDADVVFTRPDALRRVAEACLKSEIVIATPKLTGRGLTLVSTAYHFFLSIVQALGKGAYVHVWGIRASTLAQKCALTEVSGKFDDVFLGRDFTAAARTKLCDARDAIEVRNYGGFAEAFKGVSRNATRFFPLWTAPVLVGLLALGYGWPLMEKSGFVLIPMFIAKLVSDRKHGIRLRHTLLYPLGLGLFMAALAHSCVSYSLGLTTFRGRKLPTT